MSVATIRGPYPDGTSVSAYLGKKDDESVFPTWPAVETQTASGGYVTFTALTAGTEYTAVGTVSGVRRWVSFVVPARSGLQAPGFTMRVAASDASPASKVAVDYVCDGIADEVEINAAIAALPAVGGTVELSEGTFKTLAPLVCNKDNLTLRGCGAGNPFGTTPPKGGTMITPQGSFAGARIVDFSITGRVLHGCFLRDLTVNGANTTATSTGVQFDVANGGIDRCWVAQITGDGIVSHTDTQASYPQAAFDSHFFATKVQDVTGIGWSFLNGSTDHTIIGCTAQKCGSHGFYMDSQSSSNLLLGNYIYSIQGKGVYLETSWHQRIIANRIQDTNGGIYAVDTAGASLGGLEIVSNLLRNNSAAADNTTDSIQISPSASATRGQAHILGNTFSSGGGFYAYSYTGDPLSNRARYGINIASANAVGVFVGPQSQTYRTPATSTFGTGFLNDAGTGTRRASSSPRAEILAQAQGLKGQNFDRQNSANTLAMVSGTVYYILVPFQDGDLVSNILVLITTAATGLTLAKVGLYQPSNMAQLAASADVSATWLSVAGNTNTKVNALGTPYRVTQDGGLYVALVAVGAGPPTLSRNAQQGGGSSQVPGSSVSTYGAQTGQTDLPAPGAITIGGGSPASFWVGWT